MSLNLPTKLDKYAHDDIVRVLMEMNPRFFRPNRGSWQQGIPDLEDPSREVVEVALTKLRDAWGQCLYYYRSGATHIHLVLSPRHYLDYKTKESAFIKDNPIPNVEVHTLPELKIKSYLLPKNRRKGVPVPEIGFIVTDEDKQKALKKNRPKEKTKECIKQPMVNIESIPQVLDIDDEDVELDEDNLEENHVKPSVVSKLECLADKIAVALKKFKGKPVIWQQVAGSVGLEVASKEFKQAIDFLWETERIETQGEIVEVTDEKITKLEMVTVLTPCGHKALISKEAYEKEKNGENFWRSLK